MGKNLKNRDGMDKAASDSTPKGTKTMDPSPGGGMIREFKGPKIHTDNDMRTMSDGIDDGTTVESE